MNIFVVNREPKLAAQNLCDKHVVKMVLESAQILCSAFPKGDAPYKRTHYNHPCSRWARETSDNYGWLSNHAIALSEEYSYRYGKTHKSLSVIKWCIDNGCYLPFTSRGLTPFALAMPEVYKMPDPVESYRGYYIGEKSGIAKWTKREIPEWFIRHRNRSDLAK